MLVGEQPGDEEDRRGLPFVGPAGRVLDDALEQAGISRAETFVTNAVKHFKWEPRGKRRLHKKPRAQEVAACEYWLSGEIARVKPRVIVALGTTALYALTGSALTLTAARNQSLTHASGARLLATFHPSAVLRAPEESRAQLLETLVRDLRQAHRLAQRRSGARPRQRSAPIDAGS
jgi:DNA polymerase